MANMSYCRFRNTLSDLRDCYEHLEELELEEGEESEDGEPLSKEEKEAADKLVALCTKIHEMYGPEER